MAFANYLIKVGSSNVELPTSFIEGTTYKVTPNQRMEWSAERDITGMLHRDTVTNQPPKIEFATISQLTNTQVARIMSILNNAYSDAAQRKLSVNYYDPESDSYKTHVCYVPDIDFSISRIDTTSRTIWYEPIRFAFIGY